MSLLHWVRGENVGALWHLTFDGHLTVCGQHGSAWGGPPLRPHSRMLGDGPPNSPLICGECRKRIAVQLGLAPPDDGLQGAPVPR